MGCLWLTGMVLCLIGKAL